MADTGKGRVASLALLLCIVGAGVVVAFWLTTRRDRANELGASFEYDLNALGKTEPEKIGWEEAQGIPLPFAEVRALAVGPQGALYIAGDRAVLQADRAGKEVRTIGLDAPATCLACDADGTLYVGFKDRIEVYGADGARLASWPGLGEKARLTSLAAGGACVYAADAGSREVVRYDKAGGELGRIGRKDPARGVAGFVVPSPYFDLAIDDEDMVWIVDPGRQTLGLYRSDGENVSSWRRASVGIEGFCGCCNPTHIALRPDGSFVTSEKGIARVKIHGPAGDLVSVVAGPESFAKGTVGLDLAADEAGRVLVLDPVRRAVRVFVPRDKKVEGGGLKVPAPQRGEASPLRGGEG